MQPEINKIQKKYRNRKDQASMVKQNEEIQAVYEKYGVSPTGGCLQLLVQFPVFLALYQVIRKIPAYIPQVKETYMTAVTALSGQAGYINKINSISEGLKSSYVTELAKDATPDQIIDVLNYFTADAWDKLAAAFPPISGTIESVAHEITSINDFLFGINVAQTPGLHISVYLIIPILAALFQFLSAKTMMQPNMEGNDQVASMNKSMTYMMPLMSLYFCIIMPAGLGIYWVTSALFQCIQQVIINKYMDHADLEKMVAKNRAKAEKKKAKGKKSIMERLTQTSAKAEAAKEEYENRANTMREISTMNLKKINSNVDSQNVDTSTLGEIGKKAYLVSQYEKEHNTRGGKK